MDDAPKQERGVPGSPEAKRGLASAAELQKPRRRLIPRFSLRSLTLCVLLAASSFGLWWNWEPWKLALECPGAQSDFDAPTLFSPDGSRLLTSGPQRRGRLLDAQSGNLLFEFGENCERAQFTPDGKWIVCNPQDDTISVWNAATGVKQAQVEEGWGFIDQADCSPDGKRILTKTAFVLGVYTRGAGLWETDSGRLLGELATGDYVSQVAFSPDGGKALTVCNKYKAPSGGQRAVRVWDVSSGSELAVLQGFQDDVHFASFLPDGKRVLTASIFKLRLWDAASGKELASCSAAARKVVLSPTGKRLLAMESPAYGSVKMRLWDVENLAPIAALERSEDRAAGSIAEAAFSPDGKRIIVDDYASIWSGEDARVIFTLSEQIDAPHATSFDPSGLRIASTDRDGTTRVWRRRRPESWWGVAWLPEFWLTAAFALALAWSLVRDFRMLRKGRGRESR